MGLLRRIKLGEKKREKELQERVGEFKQEIGKVCKKFGMNIRPIITKFGIELEIVIVDPNKELSAEPHKKDEKIPEGHSEGLAKKI